MKKCTGCDEVKSTSSFHKNRSKKDGLASYCKLCNSSYIKSYQINNRELVNRHARNYHRNKRNE